MQHALLVRRRQPRADLARELDRFVLRQPADAPQQRREIFAVDVLHGQEVLALDHRRGRRRGRRSDARPARAMRTSLRKRASAASLQMRGGQELERDRLVEVRSWAR